MLDTKIIAIVKSTAPILEKHGEILARHFYKRMFAHNPEVAHFFNPANQATGVQQKALAGAICAYAANIDNLSVLSGTVELIAQKHVSLQIKPDLYPIIGSNLVASIKKVLGEDATDGVIYAWEQAYSFLADVLIQREEQIYHEQISSRGGWEGFKTFKVIRKETESSVITSFYLVPLDGGLLPAFKPGQYITLRIPCSDGSSMMRNYSLSDKLSQKWFRISVKREVDKNGNKPNGYVSNYLHRYIEVDATLEMTQPCGEFFLDIRQNTERPLVLLAAGVGITPILSILLTALEAKPNRKIIFIHCNLNEETQAFKKTVDALALRHPQLHIHYRYSDEPKFIRRREKTSSTGYIDVIFLKSLLPERDADYYFCGPQPFMGSIYRILNSWGIPPEQVHFEFFGPRQAFEKTL